MKLALDAPQKMLAQTAVELSQKHDPVLRLRQLRDSDDDLGFSPDVWGEMAELGWLGIPVAEDQGGLGMGMAEVVLITESLGRALAPEPYISSVIAARLLARVGGDVAAMWLPGLLDGSQRLGLAFHEPGARFSLDHVTTRANKRDGSGWTLEGHKSPVDGGHDADGWLVTARTSGSERDRDGIDLFLVPADRDGVTSSRLKRIDSLNASTLHLEDATLSSDDLVLSKSYETVEESIDAATVALCGEMVGGMSEIFRRTLEYLKEREQFGKPIGSFQALQHRAAKVFMEIELARSTMMAAARALDEAAPNARALVSNAKARCSDAYILATNEALQMHGGIGMTDEHDVGLFLKRARVCEMTFGDAAHHRDRFATLQGF